MMTNPNTTHLSRTKVNQYLDWLETKVKIYGSIDEPDIVYKKGDRWHFKLNIHQWAFEHLPTPVWLQAFQIILNRFVGDGTNTCSRNICELIEESHFLIRVTLKACKLIDGEPHLTPR